MYHIYSINYYGQPIYYNYTKDLKKEFKDINDSYKNSVKNDLNDIIDTLNEKNVIIYLNHIKSFKTLKECKMFLNYIKLSDYFGDKKLKQKI